jgi:hypothetical protein|tara:strand:- start:6477 stop:6944 length:468 start_codon:yes stop_codon:yes gene_type:complete
MTQQTEVKTDCPLCSEMHNNCFVESTEIEGEQFDSYICFQCGMTSNSYLAFDSEKLEEYTKSHSRLMNDLKIFDKKRGLVWFPSVINMGPKGIIYPEGTVNDWYWNFASVIDVPEEERDQYEGHDKRLDIENPQKFGQFEFMEACKAMGIVKDNG